MFPGQYTLCLKTLDLQRMRDFYIALGMKVHAERPEVVLLNNGDLDLALMTSLDATCLNFRGADVRGLSRLATEQGLIASEPSDYKAEQMDAEADGTSWLVHDPDGNHVFFDTNDQERGERGAALALQRVLDATAKQLVNVDAPEDCRAAFADILNRFMPASQRAKTAFGLDTSPLTEPHQFAGYFNYCLKTSNTAVSRDFYTSLGIGVTGNNDENWVSLGTSDCSLSLMTFLDSNWLNFRGADVFKLYDRMQSSGFELEGNPARYTEEEFGMPGAHWSTRDPDGNVVYFDTSDQELIIEGDPATVNGVLTRAAARLNDIRADAACIDALQHMVVRAS